MTEKKHALLLFSKPPVPGMVKTRLTTEHGGFLSPAQAAEFFKRSLYDVSELAMHALMELQMENDAAVAADPSVDKVTYDFFVSTTPAENVELMKETYDAIGPWPMEIHYLTDKGATFDDHFDYAFKEIFALGYESIVSVGGDIPTMPKSHIQQAFAWLDYFQGLGTPGFVQAPCQECGTSLVGFSRNTPIDHQGVYYNLNGRAALDAYVEKLQEKDIPSAYFSPVADIDEKTDLAHAISCMRAIEAASKHQTDLFVPRRVLDWVDYMGIQVSTPPTTNTTPGSTSTNRVPPACRLRRPANANQRIKVTMMKVLHKTTALCPTCLRELPASVFADEDGVVWMERTCPDHGRLATRMWPDAEHYQWLRSLAFSKTAPTNTIPATAPCPHGCGTCSRHQRRGTLLR